MKKQTNKLLIAGTALAALATTIVPFGNVFAATTWDTTTGSSVTLKRTIINAYGTVDVDFGYTVTADSNNPSGVTGSITPASPTISFNSSYATATNATALSAAPVSFSGLQFTQIGDYSYEIREASTNNNTFPVDTTNYYTAVISVRNNADLTGFVASRYVHDHNGDKIGTISGANTEAVFANGASYTNIQVSATASGNAAEADRCFEYTVNFTGTTDSYKVTTSPDNSCGNSGTITNGGTIKLKHGDTVTIGLDGTNSQIPVGTAYTITKGAAQGYTTTIDGNEVNSVSKTMVATNNSSYNTANKTAINQYKNSTVDSNAFMNISIYVLLAIAGGIGVYFVAKKKSKKEA